MTFQTFHFCFKYNQSNVEELKVTEHMLHARSFIYPKFQEHAV